MTGFASSEDEEAFRRDLRLSGTAILKGGRRVDPNDFFLSPEEMAANLERVRRDRKR